MSLAASLLVLCATTVSADMLQFRRDKTHSPDGLASFNLPDGWSSRDVIREPTQALIPHKKTQSCGCVAYLRRFERVWECKKVDRN